MKFISREIHVKLAGYQISAAILAWSKLQHCVKMIATAL